MSDLDFGALFHLMGRILLAVIEFSLSMLPIWLLALVAAWFSTSHMRTPFFQAKLPQDDTTGALVFSFSVIHASLTFFYALLWGTEGMSAFAVITYSLCTTYVVAIGLGFGLLILGAMWHLFGKKFIRKGEDSSGNYESVATANEHDLESGTDESHGDPEAAAKQS